MLDELVRLKVPAEAMPQRTLTGKHSFTIRSKNDATLQIILSKKQIFVRGLRYSPNGVVTFLSLSLYISLSLSLSLSL